MFEPRYTISSQLLANLKRIAVLTAELNAQPFPQVVLLRLEQNAREVSAFASTSIEGNPLPLTEVKRILKNRPENVRDSEREVLNYNAALISLEKLLRRQPVKLTIPFVCRIHRQVTRGLLPASQSGKVRQEPVLVNDPRSGKTVYLPPDHEDVLSLLKELLDYVQKNRATLDPLLLAGLFHKQFVIIHPFLDGNGRTARLLTKGLLASMGLNTFNLFSFENYYNQNVTKYFRLVGLQGNYYDLKDALDFTPWLTYFTDGLVDELLRVGKELQRQRMTPKTALRAHDKIILASIDEHGYITDKVYAGLTERAKPTRHLDFQRLIALGLIKKEGKGKATYYTRVTS